MLPTIPSGFYWDTRNLASLKGLANKDPAQAAGKVAQEFEALFLADMLKQMRSAKLASTPFDTQADKMYGQMLDNQLAQSLAGRGLGLAKMLQSQLIRQQIDMTSLKIPKSVPINPQGGE
ncbi:MAG TPA: rod-binding protein [Burkholderiales bacterium]|nr:rod-binding protein [Pseudomonadota bacterium]HVC50368.1 rod-binding protein [Burkholderiales bacterium]